MDSPIKWHGGKHYLADWIISQMPTHLHYVEPYFGSGAVLFRKSRDGVSEVANDLHKNLTCFWRVLQSAEEFERFRVIIDSMPFSQVEWRDAEVALRELVGASSVERAAAFFVLLRQSRQGLMRSFATLSKNRVRRSMNEQTSAWLAAVDGLADAHDRLQRVVILCDDAVKVIKQEDSSNTLYYLDPPYPHGARSTRDAYDHEMSDQEHDKLLFAISKVKGRFLLSGYDVPLYQQYAVKHGWRISKKEMPNSAASGETKETKIEMLWRNYA